MRSLKLLSAAVLLVMLFGMAASGQEAAPVEPAETGVRQARPGPPAMESTAPEAAPEVTPETAPEVIPEAAPEAAPVEPAPVEVLPSPAPAPPEEMITLSLSGPVDLKEFLNYVQTLTGKNFIYNPTEFQGTITLLPGSKIPRDSIMTLFETILEYNNFAMVPTVGNWIKIVRIDQASKRPTPVLTPDALLALPETDAVLTVAYPLKYMSAQEAITTLTPLTLVQGGLVALPRANVLLMTDYAHNLKRLVTFVDVLDNEELAPRLRIFKLQYASAENVAQQILRIIRAEAALSGASKEQQLSHVDADPSTNQLIALAPGGMMARIEDLIATLDVEPAPGNRNIRIYPLQNAKAEDVQATLEQLTMQQPSGVRVVPGARPGPQVPGAGPVGGPTAIGEIPVKIIGDKSTNSVVVLGPPEIQSEMAALIAELDRRKAQVLIEALVVQVSASADLDIGVELATFGADGLGVTNFDFSEFDFETGTREIIPGLGITGAVLDNGDIPILLRALLVDNKGQIVSRPRLLVKDNEEALFKSVDEEPTTSVNTLTSTTATTSFNQYVQAGTTLKIKPYIGEGDYLTLEMALEVSQFTGASTSAEVPPAKRTDTLESRVTLPDESTIVIGGLSGLHTETIVSKVPILGDIPILGFLFRRTSDRRDDTTEYIFIKASIMNDVDFSDLKNLSEESRQRSVELEKAVEEEAPVWAR